MKRMTPEEKKAELNKYCRKQACMACPLVVTAFCQNNDASDEAVNDAYEVYLKTPSAAAAASPSRGRPGKKRSVKR